MKFKDMPYKRVEKEQVEQDFRKLMEEFQAAKSGEEQFAVHQKYYKLWDEVMTDMTIAQIRYDVDTSDEFYDKEREYYDELAPVLSNLQIEYQKLLYNSPYREYLESKIGIWSLASRALMKS